MVARPARPAGARARARRTGARRAATRRLGGGRARATRARTARPTQLPRQVFPSPHRSLFIHVLFYPDDLITV